MSTSHGPARVALPVLIVLALAAFFGWFVLREPDAPPSVGTGLVAPAPSVASPAGAGGQPPGSSAGATAPAPQSSSAVAPPPATSDPAPAPGERPAAAGPPSFDVVRIEPDGSSVVAGRAAPGSTVELRRNGAVLATGKADAAGAFAFLPPPLDPGSHELTLDAVGPDGVRTSSRQSVTASIAANRTDRPLVTVTAPDQPTTILSEPAAPPPAIVASGPEGRTAAGETARPGQAGAGADGSSAAAGSTAGPGATGTGPAVAPSRPLRIATVEAEGEGRLFVSGEAAPGTTLRLYLNDTFVAPGQTGPDGRLSFDIGRGIRPGDYKVRLDEVDPVTGSVRSRAEVPFTVPAPSVVAAAPTMAPATDRAGSPDRTRTDPGTPAATTGPAGTDAGANRAASSAAASGASPGAAASAGGSSQAGRDAARAGGRDAGSPSGGDTGRVTVPEIATSLVSRGDSLWRISKRVYGAGLRYTVIYDANAPQIRNPDLIYPGQVFVLPTR